MLSDWLLMHPMGPYAVWWAVAGVWLATRARGALAWGAVAGLLGAAGLSAAAGLDWIASLWPVIDPHGMTPDGVWWVVLALLVLSTRRTDIRPGLLSALPLVWMGPFGGGALAAAVVVVATSALERGQAGRGWLLAGLGLLGAATWMEHTDLQLWLWLGQVGLGGDSGSLVLAVAGAVLGGLGVGAVARSVAARFAAGRGVAGPAPGVRGTRGPGAGSGAPGDAELRQGAEPAAQRVSASVPGRRGTRGAGTGGETEAPAGRPPRNEGAHGVSGADQAEARGARPAGPEERGGGRRGRRPDGSEADEACGAPSDPCGATSPTS